MEDLGWAAIAALIGVCFALQSAFMGAVGRERGPVESVYISLTVTVIGVALALLILQAGLRDLQLPAAVRTPWIPLATLIVSAAIFAGSMRGLRPIYGVMGLLGLVFMLAAPVIIPEVGVALFVAASTAGSLVSALIFDHQGWFGSDVRRINPTRIAGVALLVVGVILIAG